MDEIHKLEQLTGAGINEAKVRTYHGAHARNNTCYFPACRTTHVLFLARNRPPWTFGTIGLGHTCRNTGSLHSRWRGTTRTECLVYVVDVCAVCRKPQIVLADETTKLLHGEACLKEIHQTVKQVFAGGVGGSNAALPRYANACTLVRHDPTGG